MYANVPDVMCCHFICKDKIITAHEVNMNVVMGAQIYTEGKNATQLMLLTVGVRLCTKGSHCTKTFFFLIIIINYNSKKLHFTLHFVFQSFP